MSKPQVTLETLDAALLAEVAALRADDGVLTVVASRGEAGAIEIRSALHRHRATFPLDDVTDEAVAIADDHLPGASHAFVADLSSGAHHAFALPVPADTLVAIGTQCDVEPIARAYADAAPVGVVDVRHDGVRLVECTAAGAHELGGFHFTTTGDWTEFRGPSRAQPQRSFESSSQRELFERRVAAQRARQLPRVADSVARRAAAQGWTSTVVAGDRELAQLMAAALPQVHEVDRHLPAWESAGELALEIADDLRSAREESVLAEVRETREHPERFAAGPAHALAAIHDGRATEVLVDAAALGDQSGDLIRTALAHRAAVRFADGHLAHMHGAASRLHGRPRHGA